MTCVLLLTDQFLLSTSAQTSFEVPNDDNGIVPSPKQIQLSAVWETMDPMSLCLVLDVTGNAQCATGWTLLSLPDA